jgi:hypothetical protein
MRLASRLSGNDCNHTRPGPRSVAKKPPLKRDADAHSLAAARNESF